MNLHQLGYWVEIYRKAGDPGWDQILAWNLAIAGLLESAARVGEDREHAKWMVPVSATPQQPCEQRSTVRIEALERDELEERFNWHKAWIEAES